MERLYRGFDMITNRVHISKLIEYLYLYDLVPRFLTDIFE